MRYCIQCNKIETMCGCISPRIVNQTTINSDAAGRDGLDAKDIAIRTGKLPAGATDNQFIDLITGPQGEPGLNGQSQYENTEW